MSEVLDLQVYSLLARLHEMRDDGCHKLRNAAEAQAHELLTAARHRARRRVRQAVIEKRRRVEEHCLQVRVALESRARATRFAALGAALATALEALPAALAARWADGAARRSWWRTILEDAGQVLRPGRWTVLVAPGLDAAESEELAGAAAALAGQPVELREEPGLTAGLAIVHDSARYDGSIAGLLSDGTGVRAALLAELAAVKDEP